MLPVVTSKKLINYQNNKKKQFIYYPAGTQRHEDVPLWFYFARDVPDYNRTKIERIRFLTYFGFAKEYERI